jgi:hypothetical protein
MSAGGPSSHLIVSTGRRHRSRKTPGHKAAPTAPTVPIAVAMSVPSLTEIAMPGTVRALADASDVSAIIMGMLIPMIGGPLHGNHVSDAGLPPAGVRASFYAVRGDGSADAYRLRRFRETGRSNQPSIGTTASCLTAYSAS